MCKYFSKQFEGKCEQKMKSKSAYCTTINAIPTIYTVVHINTNITYLGLNKLATVVTSCDSVIQTKNK